METINFKDNTSLFTGNSKAATPSEIRNKFAAKVGVLVAQDKLELHRFLIRCEAQALAKYRTGPPRKLKCVFNWKRAVIVLFKGVQDQIIEEGEFSVRSLRKAYWESFVELLTSDNEVIPVLLASGLYPLIDKQAIEVACTIDGVAAGVIAESDIVPDWNRVIGYIIGSARLAGSKRTNTVVSNEVLTNIVNSRLRGLDSNSFSKSTNAIAVTAQNVKRTTGSASNQVSIADIEAVIGQL